MADTIQNDDLNKPKQPASSITQPAGQPGQPQVGTQQPKPQGTGFTNIQRVIGANQGNRLGSTVVGGIQQQGRQVQNQLGTATQQFGQQVQQNNLNSGQNQQASQDLVNKATSGGDISNSDAAQAEKFRNGQYTGPTDLTNSNLLLGQAANAEQLGKLSGTEGGRQGLLQRFVGAPQYSQGQQKLDTLLLGANGQALNQARSATQGLSDQTLRQVQGARAQGQQAANESQQFGKNFNDILTGKTQGVNSDVQKALDTAKAGDTARGTDISNLQTGLQGYFAGDKSKSLDQILGSSQLDNATKSQLRDTLSMAEKAGLDPTAYIQGTLQNNASQGLTSNGVMNSQQAASLNALAKLSGQPTTQYGNDVGTYKAGNEAADVSKLKSGDIQDAYNNKTAYDMNKGQVPGLQNNVQNVNKAFQNPQAVNQILQGQDLVDYNSLQTGMKASTNPLTGKPNQVAMTQQEKNEMETNLKNKFLQLSQQKLANINSMNDKYNAIKGSY